MTTTTPTSTISTMTMTTSLMTSKRRTKRSVCGAEGNEDLAIWKPEGLGERRQAVSW